MATMNKYPAALLKEKSQGCLFSEINGVFQCGLWRHQFEMHSILTNDGVMMVIQISISNKHSIMSFPAFSTATIRIYLIRTAWKKANITDFDYNDPEAGVGAIRNNQSSQDLDTLLCEKGFITQYAYSGLENDLNTVAQNLFKPDEGFWETVDKYPRIRQKVKLLIAFYNKTRSYFHRKLFQKS